MPVPPKDPSLRRRRNPTPGFRQLPREGRAKPPPPWPLPRASAEEEDLWTKLWSLPQAIEWERMRCEDLVAMYVRAFVDANSPGTVGAAQLKLMAEVRQFDAMIGLSPKAMQGLRWEIEELAAEIPAEKDAQSGEPVLEYVPRSPQR